jgi:hypothetical protein
MVRWLNFFLGKAGKRRQRCPNRVIEALDGGEAAVGERFVDELPKVFGRLELGTVGGLEYQTNAVGHGEVLGSVPAGIVELKHDAPIVVGAHRSGKSTRTSSKNSSQTALAISTPSGRSPARRNRSRRAHEAMMAERDRAFSDRCPYGCHIVPLRPNHDNTS